LGKLFGKLMFHEYLVGGGGGGMQNHFISFHFLQAQKFSILSLHLLLIERFFDVLLLFAVVVELGGHLRNTHPLTHRPSHPPLSQTLFSNAKNSASDSGTL
jgi:hypothetical protein